MQAVPIGLHGPVVALQVQYLLGGVAALSLHPTIRSMRQASLSDIGQLLALMAEFYTESGYSLDSARAAEAFRTLLSDERLGCVWLIQANGLLAGYMVVTLGYSMEYGGLDAFIDDLYVRPPFRHAGLGATAVQEARRFCADRGVRALHLEVDEGNAVAHNIYRRAGFVNNGRRLLTLRLPVPTHAA